MRIRFSRRGLAIVVIEDKDAPESELSLLDRFYELHGLRDAAWIREVDEHKHYVVILPPTYYLAVDFQREEAQWPEWL